MFYLKIKIKSLINFTLNSLLLKPFNLKIIYNVGINPLNDIKHLFFKNKIEIKNAIDGGAYVGQWSLDLIKIAPKVNIFLFEPQKKIFNLLKQKFLNYKNIKLFNFAIGKSKSKKSFFINSLPLSSSILKTSPQGHFHFKELLKTSKTVEVNVISLDYLFKKEIIQEVDILKLDLQGMELEALKGIGKYLKNVKLIYIEVSFLRFYNKSPLFSEIDFFLKKSNFNFFQFYDQVRSKKNGRLLYADAIFVNSNYFKK